MEHSIIPLCTEKIREALPDRLSGFPITVFDIIDSTNTRAKTLALSGAPHGTLLLAEEQTAGRGRTGKRFYSPKGTGLYMTLILRSENNTDAQLLTIFAAVAVCKGIESLLGLSPQIKWVNDLYINDKKICGILCEAVKDAYIVGVGINCATETFPDELSLVAGSLSTSLSRNQLAAEIYKNLLTPARNILTEYKKRSLMSGRTITCEKNGIAFSAVVLDINDCGNLVVRKESGETVILSSGEVKIKL